MRAVVSKTDKVNICIYADDFIITGATRTILEEKVKPVVESFLKARGLTLSQEKTHITSIDEGFKFLSIWIRKYNGKFLMKPSKDSVKACLKDIREIIKSNPAIKTEDLIYQLTPKIRGWVNDFRYVYSK